MNAGNSVVLTKRVIITSSNPITKEDFVKKIGEIAKNIVDFLKKNGCTKLGHMKFISTTDGEDYLQLSILDIAQKPKINGILRKTFDKIKLTFNIIEFGVGKEEIDSKINEEIKNIQVYFNNK
ncbi:MAG: hypothetical protein Q8N27_03425 [Candidatus Hydromicrobium sp.]|jgi:hypothetical protein|nr:hypothetical protein [Actinomycetota bacterium]MDP3011746.1 hypothetical protein [Candidatus Hydromicrobium sp.]